MFGEEDERFCYGQSFYAFAFSSLYYYARSEEEPEHPFPQFCVLYEASRKVLSASFSNLGKTYQFDIWLFSDGYFDHFFNLC